MRWMLLAVPAAQLARCMGGREILVDIDHGLNMDISIICGCYTEFVTGDVALTYYSGLAVDCLRAV